MTQKQNRKVCQCLRLRVVDYQSEIKQKIRELPTLEKRQLNAKSLLRVQLLRLLKCGEFSQLKKATKVLGITEEHSYQLWNKCKVIGLGGYVRLNYLANRAKLDAEQQAKLLERASTRFD